MAHFLMSAADLTRTIEDFLTDCPQSIVVEDGQVIFDLSSAKYSISAARDKCVLEMWSEERNHVRRVEAAELKNGALRLSVRKFGEARPHKIEICSEADRRTPTAKKAARSAYQRLLERTLQRSFPDFVLEHKRLSTAVDLEHSFGPAYARGLLRKGRSAFAVLGVGNDEAAATVDAALAIGLLWLDHCRNSFDRGAVQGLKLFLPLGRSETVRARAAHLGSGARVRIFEVQERDEVLTEFDAFDGGNIATRLVHAPNEATARERFASAIEKIEAMVPRVDIVVASAGEISFRLHGLEFARARAGIGSSFSPEQRITFGAGRFEVTLTDDNQEQFHDLMKRVAVSRGASGDRRDALWRLQPERWLESMVIADITAIDAQLDPSFVYSQVPAFAASDRAMIDVLARTRSGRLAVIELKADEDLQLPMQGLDYWSRVHFHQQREEFQKFGYFPGKTLTNEPPLLYLVAPALRVHPSTDALMKFLSGKVDWHFVGVNEDWRNGLRVIFRKSRKS
ncbi:MAG TPA: hypothetical protein VMZ25_02205 [Terriglobales bacterium]|nr:hypothetical protein [Terriglobales bacterium]